MRILLLHSKDNPLVGPWIPLRQAQSGFAGDAGPRWDAVFDLARSGWAACERWSSVFGCSVRPIDELRENSSLFRRVRELLQFGLGRLVDGEGLDWWELTAILVHQQLEVLVLLRKLADEVGPGAEVFITRDGFEAQALRMLIGNRLHVMAARRSSGHKGVMHYASRLKSLPSAQIVEILGDKYDGGYRLRRYWHRQPSPQTKPVVLLPSAYINVSLLGTQYARLLPQTRFLLVCTRRSGRLRALPANVEQAWLASYAAESGAEEGQDLLKRWAELKKEIGQMTELGMLVQLGLMDDFPARIAQGLAVRNAWRRVLEWEPVKAVLCGDDSNPYTHIPLLLARKRNLPTIACHHGGLDGRYLIKTNHADVILAKGKMERDYLVSECGVNPSEVEIGAPSVPEGTRNKSERGERIVFFSEPYEIPNGRTEEIYRDVLPGLVELATRCGRKLTMKLHPAENLPDRQGLAEKLLVAEKRGAIEWLTGRLDARLLENTWFGLTAQSSAAMDCLIHGVPCFFCEWLDLWPYGYVAQYRKFGVGIGLRTPEEIANIPEILEKRDSRIDSLRSCWEPIVPDRLGEMLSKSRARCIATPEPLHHT